MLLGNKGWKQLKGVSSGVEPSFWLEDAGGGSSKKCSNLFLASFNESPEHFPVKRRKK